MFGCTDPAQVLKEVAICAKQNPNAYVRVAGFDAKRQVQVVSFLVHRPAASQEWRPVKERSIMG